MPGISLRKPPPSPLLHIPEDDPLTHAVTSSWYTRTENPLRMAIWHAGNTISNIISGFLAAGILTGMKNTAGLHSWQWFFIIEGGISIIVAVAAWFALPDWPHNTRWMNPEETEMALYRVLCSNGGVEEEVGGTWDGLWEAVKEPFTWCFCLMHFALVTAQSFKDFLPSVRRYQSPYFTPQRTRITRRA